MGVVFKVFFGKVTFVVRVPESLEEAPTLYGYDINSLTYICSSAGSQYHSSNDTTHMSGMNIHEHTIACADKLMKCRRTLERSCHRQNRKQHRAASRVEAPV